LNKRAQSFLEYSLLIGIISAAVISINTYIKRGVQAQIKVSCDELAPQEYAVYTYDPKKEAYLLYSENAIAIKPDPASGKDYMKRVTTNPGKSQTTETSEVTESKPLMGEGGVRPSIYLQGAVED